MISISSPTTPQEPQPPISLEELLVKLRELVNEAISAALPKSTIDDDPRFTEKEAAHWLRVKPQTLALWRHEGRGPEYRKHGSRVIYFQSALIDYSENNRVRRA